MNDTQRRAMQIGIPALLLLVGLIGGWVAHALILPPGQTATAMNYSGWTVSCPPYSVPKVQCTISMPIIDKQSGITVASVVMGRAPDGLKLAVTLPLNVLLVPGMALIVGSDPMRAYHYETCTAQGCIATIPLDDKLLASLRGAKDAKLEFAMPNKENKPIAVTFALDGFAKAHDVFQRDEALRNSWWRRLWS